MFALIFGLFGLIIGSFLNVVVLRSGVGPITGRSECMSCGTKLTWYDLVPVLSWAWLRGRCRTCGSSISIQYPLVELSTALCFGIIGGAPFLIVPYQILSCLIGAVLVAIAAYDMRHTIIPDMWVYLFCALALVDAFPFTDVSLIPIGVSLLAGPFAALPLFILWAVSSGRWMGFGDVKLALGIGWLLGPLFGLFAVMASFVLGALIMVPLLLVGKFTHSTRFSIPRMGLTMKSEVPFGPFLIATCFFVWFSLLYNIPLPFPFLA